jgi:hypothetical protein
MTEEVFSKKPKKKKNILFKRSFDDSIFKKISSDDDDISDNDERVIKEIDRMMSCCKPKMKKTATKMPTIEEAMSFIMLR